MGNNETFVPVGIVRYFTENWPIAKLFQTTFYCCCGHHTFVCNYKFPVFNCVLPKATQFQDYAKIHKTRDYGFGTY